ncbi:MAG: hypothetical protein ACK5LL_03250 [Suipraeoptans sp.]
MVTVPKINLAELYFELIAIERRGILLFLGYSPATSDEVYEAHMLCEEGGYMRDYWIDETDSIQRLYFHYVRE